METNILDLPNELLLEILKFLNLNATINVDDCICRRWRDIGEYSRLWSELKLGNEDWRTASGLKATSGRFWNWTWLALVSMFVEAFSFSLSHFMLK